MFLLFCVPWGIVSSYLYVGFFPFLFIFPQIFVGSWLSVQTYSCWDRLVTVPRGIISTCEERSYFLGSE